MCAGAAKIIPLPTVYVCVYFATGYFLDCIKIFFFSSLLVISIVVSALSHVPWLSLYLEEKRLGN